MRLFIFYNIISQPPVLRLTYIMVRFSQNRKSKCSLVKYCNILYACVLLLCLCTKKIRITRPVQIVLQCMELWEMF